MTDGEFMIVNPRRPVGERIVALLTAVALLHVQVPALLAQAPPVQNLAQVEYVGLKRVTRVFADDVVRLRLGEPINARMLDEANDRLLRTGRFLTVRYRVEEIPAGARVVFDVRERATVSEIRFKGNSHFRDGQLREELTIKPGDPVELFAARDGRDAIMNKYRQAGYGEVSVEFDQKAFEDDGTLQFTITEGKRTRIRKISFQGNGTFSSFRLSWLIKTSTAFWFFRPGVFDKDEVEGDVSRIQGFYRDEGFLDAQVNYLATASDEGRRLHLTFTIDEGTRYKVESVEFKGQTVFADTELAALIKSNVEGIAKPPRIDADAKAIQTRYGELGYINATCRAVRVFSSSPGYVKITFEVTEGEQFRVGEITVRGNARTKDKVARRALNLYPPDDLFNLTEARDAERKLRETRIFSAARVVPTGDKPGVRDALVDVTEADKTGDFIFGFGITSNSGLVGNLVLDLFNFDIEDTPRSWKEFVKFRSFFGGGQRLRLELQPGTEVNRFRIDFTEPYLFDRPLRFDTSFYLFERDRDGYTESRVGGSVSLGKRFDRGVFQGWSGEIATKLENVDVDDVDLLASRQIRKDEGSNLLTSLKGTMVLDRTDSRLLPTTGDRLRFAYEQFGALGGDHLFGKFTTGYTWYYPVFVDAQDRKSVLELSAEGGAIAGDAPVFERYYAGGTGSIRGFEFRGVSPRDGLQKNAVGGDTLLLMGAEYSYPLYGENLRGMIFVDSGTVDFDVLRVAVGTGVRFTIELFGPLPIELNLAVPVVRDEDDEEQFFSFLIGTVF